MKRKLAGLLAALLVLSMGTTVFAAVSPTAEDIAAEATSAASVVTKVNATFGGKNVVLEQKPLDNDTYLKTVEKAESLGNDADLLGAVDLTVPEGYTKGESITVTLNLSGITATDGTNNIRVLHYNGYTWETLIPNAVSAGSVTVTLDSLSPVAVVRTAETDEGNGAEDDANPKPEPKDRTNDGSSSTDADETSGSNTNTNTSNTGSSSSGGNTQTNNNYQTVNVYTTGNGTNGNGTSASAQKSASTSTTSPKTGASLPALPIIAVLAIMGIAVCGKKARSLS
jgi:hypothetical protein